MWLISGDTKDTVIYCYIIVISKLIKNKFVSNKVVNNYVEYGNNIDLLENNFV